MREVKIFNILLIELKGSLPDNEALSSGGVVSPNQHQVYTCSLSFF
jgi:hypothetical protein